LIAKKLAEKREKEVAEKKAAMEALKAKFIEAKKAGDTETVKAIMAQLKAMDAANKAAAAGATAAAPAAPTVTYPSDKKWTLAELRGKPPGLNHAKLETYLSDAQFKAVFKMTKPEFLAMAPARQQKFKEALQLA